MGYSYSLNVPDVSTTTFWIVVAVLMLITIFLALYNGMFVFYFGKPMRKYLTARISAGLGVIQLFEHENLFLHLADLKSGGVFIDKEEKDAKPIIPDSVVTVNGVRTTFAWNLTPKLPEAYTCALEKLIELGYNNIDEVNADLGDKIIKPDDILLDNITYTEFQAMHERVKNRNSISIHIDDILNFNQNFLDEHPRKSLIERLINVEKEKRREKKYQKWAFMIVGALALGGLLLKGYMVIHGGK